MDVRSRIFGCLLGGAIGDAFGYPLTFLSREEMNLMHGSYWLREYVAPPLVSDETQMMLFTAEGVTEAGDQPIPYAVEQALFRWLDTQELPFIQRREGTGRLWNDPRMYRVRSSSLECRNALAQSRAMDRKGEYLATRFNKSKDSVSLVRSAVIGFVPTKWTEEQMALAAEVAAITCGHADAIIPAVLLSYIIRFCLMGHPLWDCVRMTIGNAYLLDARFRPYCDKLQLALDMTKNLERDVTNIHALGGGWAADEALAIAVYCAVKYNYHYRPALTQAVCHDGAGDTTGALCGMLLGVSQGPEIFERKFTDKLELYDVIEDTADRLAQYYEEHNHEKL